MDKFFHLEAITPLHSSKKFAQGSENYEKEEHFSKEHAGRPAEVSFCMVFLDLAGFRGELLCEPKTTTTPRKTGLRKLKICKLSLVFGKICFFFESLSSVAVFGWILTMQTEGFGTNLVNSASGGKQYVFGFKISQIL